MSYLSSLNIHPQGQTSLWHSGKAQPSDAPEMRENNCQLKTFSSGRCAYPKWLTVHSRYIFDQYVYSQRSIMLYKLSSRSVLIAIKRKCQNQERYSTLSRLHQCAVHRLCTAHFPLYAELHFSLKVCFVLITSKGHPFISASHLPLSAVRREEALLTPLPHLCSHTKAFWTSSLQIPFALSLFISLIARRPGETPHLSEQRDKKK